MILGRCGGQEKFTITPRLVQVSVFWWPEISNGGLVGGLEHLLFFHILGIILSFDIIWRTHIFQRGRLKPPTSQMVEESARRHSEFQSFPIQDALHWRAENDSFRELCVWKPSANFGIKKHRSWRGPWVEMNRSLALIDLGLYFWDVHRWQQTVEMLVPERSKVRLPIRLWLFESSSFHYWICFAQLC